MLDVLHELVDAVASLKAIDGSKQAELHARLVQAEADSGTRAKPAPAAAKADVPA